MVVIVIILVSDHDHDHYHGDPDMIDYDDLDGDDDDVDLLKNMGKDSISRLGGKYWVLEQDEKSPNLIMRIVRSITLSMKITI